MLTFQELICASPFYLSEIICGWKGKEKTFSKIEIDIVLDEFDQPTFLMVPSNIETVSKLHEYIVIQNIQGILLYGEVAPYIPSATIDLANSYLTPILYLKEENNPISLQKAVTDFSQLKSLGLYHYVFEHSTNYWLQLVDNHGLSSFLNRISLLLDQEVFLLDEHFYLHPTNEGHKQDRFKHLEKIYYQQVLSNKKDVFSIIKEGEQHFFLFPIFSNDQSYGFILFQEQPSMMIDVCTEQVIYTIPALLSYFKKEEAILLAHQSYKEDFLYNLLYNNIESEQLLIQKGNQWGWDFTKQTELMVMRLNQKDESIKFNLDIESIMKKIRSIISARFLQAITFHLQGDIIIIVFHSDYVTQKQQKENALLLANYIYKRIQKDQPNLRCEIGIGRHYPSNIELFRSFYEAKVALKLGKYELKEEAVRHFEDIGISRLLSNIHQNILQDYYAEILNDILIDKENYKDYIETLEEYFQNNADINQTAEKLFVHPNTLRKRLKKIETTLSVDFNRIDDLLEIYIALKIMKMIR